MKYTMSSGHADKVRGAKGILDERNEAVKMVDKVASYIKELGEQVEVYHDKTSTTQKANVNGIVSHHNKTKRDLDISIHFNANKETDQPMGTEVLHYNSSSKDMASKLSTAIAKAGGFKNRGAKVRTDLGFLRDTNEPAVLIEVCFVDSKADAELYKKNFDKICQAIAETLTGKKLSEVKKAVETKTTNYNIKLGDTLSAIATKYGTTSNKILKLNPTIKNANKIFVGQKIKLPK